MICLVLGIPLANANLSCFQIQTTLIPCLGYVRQLPGPVVPAPCCNGVNTINNLARTKIDRIDTCNCLKSIITRIPGINYDAVAALPDKCGVPLPFKISPDINCDGYVYHQTIYFTRPRAHTHKYAYVQTHTYHLFFLVNTLTYSNKEYEFHISKYRKFQFDFLNFFK
jgi:hypothetical protein